MTTPSAQTPRRFKLPHAFVLMFLALALACIATFLLPAGKFDRADRVIGEGKTVTSIVPGSYAHVPRSPVGPIGMLVSVQKGLVDAADVIFLVFLVGGAFAAIERTGALEAGLGWLLARLKNNAYLTMVPVIILFALGGATFGMSEEVIAFVPMLLLLSRRLGLDKTMAAALCIGAATVGYGFAPLNPFSVGVAQSFASLPLFSGIGFRSVVCSIAVGLFIVHCFRYTRRIRRDGIPPGAEFDAGGGETVPDAAAWSPLRHGFVLLVLVSAVVALVVGVMKYEWYMMELSVLFLAAGLIAGVFGGLGLNGTAEAFVKGFSDIAFGALIIGIARAIKVVLEQGQIIDTVVYGLFTPLADLPAWVAGLGLFGAQGLLHFFIPSSSGQATATMPIAVPLADLLGLTRQTAVLAFQYGDGVTNLFWPTQGSLVAVIATARLPFDVWLRFILPFVLQAVALAVSAILVAYAIGLGPA